MSLVVPPHVPDLPDLVVPPHVPDLPDRLDALARRVGRLSPSHREPERYHEEKSEIAFELRVLARLASTR